MLVALAVGGLIGLFQGALIAYLAIPSFIVTLGGLLVWRGAAWWVTTGQTVAPMDTRFKALGGGVEGAIGATATWIIAAVACGLIVIGLGFARRRRLRFGFPVRPLWADAVIAALRLRRRARRRPPSPMPIRCRPASRAGSPRRSGIAWPEGGLVHPARRRGAGPDRHRGRHR